MSNKHPRQVSLLRETLFTERQLRLGTVSKTKGERAYSIIGPALSRRSYCLETETDPTTVHVLIPFSRPVPTGHPIFFPIPILKWVVCNIVKVFIPI